MLEGRIVQEAPPRELFERPTSAAVARFFGSVNLLRGDVRDGRLAVAGHGLRVSGPDGAATFAIRPEHVVLDGGGLRATVVEAVYAGTYVRLTLRVGEQRLIAHALPDRAPSAGAEVEVQLPVERLWRLPDDDEGGRVHHRISVEDAAGREAGEP